MASTLDMVSCSSSDGRGAATLPLNPFLTLNYHFGMLLGVDDFETLDAYHRAKMWLHNAWLHREGVVWGFGVEADLPRGEIRVRPGLTLDGAGHELHLEAEACVNVGSWFDAHRNDPGFEIEEVREGEIVDGRRFRAHVLLRFRPCLTRQVPALLEPCEGSGQDTAFSRVFETVELLLVPNLAPERSTPYHRLRLLFGIDEPATGEEGDPLPADADVIAARDSIAALPEPGRAAAWTAAFRRFAALDGIDLRPATASDGGTTLLFPSRDDAGVVLANLTEIVLDRRQDAWVLVTAEVDPTVRPSHVATTTIQELLAGPFAAVPDEAEQGPRLNPESVEVDAQEIRITADASLHAASVTADAVSVTSFSDAGWEDSAISGVAYDAAARRITVSLADPLEDSLVRIIVQGTGPRPVMGANHVPLAGATGGPQATRHDGRDFVFMHRRS
jgi:hypothetical protein